MTVEVLEGERPVREVPLAGLVEDFVRPGRVHGHRGAAPPDAAGKGDTASGVFLAVDPAQDGRAVRAG